MQQRAIVRAQEEFKNAFKYIENVSCAGEYEKALRLALELIKKFPEEPDGFIAVAENYLFFHLARQSHRNLAWKFSANNAYAINSPSEFSN